MDNGINHVFDSPPLRIRKAGIRAASRVSNAIATGTGTSPHVLFCWLLVPVMLFLPASPATSDSLLRHGFRSPSDRQLNLLLVATTDVSDSVQAILVDLGLGYDYVEAGTDWSVIDFTPYDMVLFAIADCAVGDASLAAVRSQLIDQGKRVVFLGGSSSAAFVNGVNDHLMHIDTASYNWKVATVPHLRVRSTSHPLARLLPSEYIFNNSNAARYCIRILDATTMTVADNGDDEPCLVVKSDYGTGGDMIWFTNDPSEYAWSIAADLDILAQVIANCLPVAGECSLLVLHTISVDESLFMALDELGYSYDSLFGDDWQSLDASAYDMVFAALDGGDITAVDVGQLYDQVVANGNRLMVIGGTATTAYVQAIHDILFALDTSQYQWTIPPPTHLWLWDNSHFLTTELPQNYNFDNESAARFQLRVRSGDVEIAARNGLNETVLFYADLYNAGDVVCFSNSPRGSYWTDEEDYEIFRTIIANSIRCGARSDCGIAVISDDSQLAEATVILDSMALDYTVFEDNGTALFTEDPFVIGQYDVVFWYTTDRLITELEYVTVEDWVQDGGRLLLTGYDCLGSPSDDRVRRLIRSSTFGDGPFEGFFQVGSATHPIVNGPYGSWIGGTDLRCGHSDHDYAIADQAEGAASIATLTGGVGKIIATEGIGADGRVVFWNGNLDAADWTNTSSRVHCQKLLKNTLAWLCSFPAITPTPQPTPAPSPTPPPVPATGVTTGLLALLVLGVLIGTTGAERK
ncbi:hypothetical protein JW905_15480 [bacterium]|nr:hypothetical protein [candidate division CSSED10-310 bacterium]